MKKLFQVPQILLIFRLFVGYINSNRILNVLALFITLHILQNPS